MSKTLRIARLNSKFTGLDKKKFAVIAGTKILGVKSNCLSFTNTQPIIATPRQICDFVNCCF